MSQTASITGASGGGMAINSGDRTNATTLTLNGTYSGNALGSDYSVHVLDGSTDLGATSKDDNNKTWTFTPTAELGLGSHSFTAVVVRNSDSLKGTASDAYTVKVGNSVGATSGSNVLDTITLSLSNLWNSVKSVVFTFPGVSGDLKDGQTSKTLTAPDNGLWSSITTAFKTTGNKIINLVFKDQADQEVDRSSINVNIATGTVSQKASITDVQDDRADTAVTVIEGNATKDSTPLISGSIDKQLSTDMSPFYDVKVYDNGTALTGALTYTNSSNKKDWKFTPASALSQGQHAFTAKVVRFDGQAGEASATRNAIVLTANPSFTPSSPKVGDTVTFSVNNLYSGITSVDWNLDDGNNPQTTTPSNGTSTVSTRYGSQGNKTVTVTYKNVSGAELATDTLPVSVAVGTVSQTASITGASSGGTTLNSGDRTDSLAITLSGTYTGNALGNDYSVHVLDGSTDLGATSKDDNNKTWTFTPTAELGLGSHSFTAVVVRNSDSIEGLASSPYTVKIGNSVIASNSSPKAWDEFTLTLSKVWSNVKSVVFKFATNVTDMADGILTQTVNLANNAWDSVTTAFKTAGQTKTITATFFEETNGEGAQVDSNSINLNVGSANVTQTATITDVKDGNNTIANNGTTTNLQPTISGTVSPALGKYYKVNLYDGSSILTGTMIIDPPRTSWKFTPDTAFSAGSHSLTAKVATFDGSATGSASGTRTFTIPHIFNDTGITADQCYRAGNNTLISCTISAATNLNSQQDGMVGPDVSNPANTDGKLGFSFSLVPRAGGGTYDKTECVKDNITGLMWEGKPASGIRGNPELNPSGTYTNYATGFGTDAQVNANSNAQVYVNAVNAAGLCGYDDWRLPTVSELQSIVDYGVASGPTIDGNWFPNTQSDLYWTSSRSVGNSDSAWGVSFLSGLVSSYRVNGGYFVRLVR